MGRYSDALRKIEEERTKRGKPSSGESIGRKLRGYFLGASVLFLIILAVVYGYGLRTGARFTETSSHAQPSPQAELPFADKISPKPVLPEGAQAPQENQALLENLETMMKVSYGTVPNVSTPTPPVETPEVKQPEGDFYTIQLVTYENEESARQEAKKLRNEGYRSLILRSKRYFSVCIGRFPDEAQANQGFSELKNTFSGGAYEDAFVRYVKPKIPSE